MQVAPHIVTYFPKFLVVDVSRVSRKTSDDKFWLELKRLGMEGIIVDERRSWVNNILLTLIKQAGYIDPLRWCEKAMTYMATM